MEIDPIERHPKPAFPQWVRRLDPSLAAEDTNAIFQAFRRRRKVHARRFGRFWSFGHIKPQHLAMILGTILLVVLLARFIGCLAFFLGSVALGYLSTRLGRTAIHQAVLGRSASAIFGSGGYLELAALDLWMTGCGGKVVAEAIYLEEREARRCLGLVLLWAVWLALMIPMLAAAGASSSRGLIVAAIVGCWLWVGWQFSRLVVVGSADDACLVGLDARRSIWRGQRVKGRMTTLTALIPVFVFAGLLGGVAVLLLRSWIMDSFPPESWVCRNIRGMAVFGWMCFIAACGLVARLLTARFSRRQCATLDDEFKRTGWDYESFMRGVVLGDADQ